MHTAPIMEPCELTMREFVTSACGLPQTNEFTTAAGARVRVYGNKYCTKELNGSKTYFVIR